MAYATLAQLTTYLGIASDDDDALLDACLNRVTEAIDAYCDRFFEAATQTRHYQSDAVDGDVLYLDEDLLSVTTLTNGDDDGTAITSDSYWLMPRNRTPYDRIVLKSDTSWEFGTDGEIAVAGTWGYSTTPPADVEQACLRWAAYAYQQKDSQVFDVTAMPALGQMIIPSGIPADVKQLMDRYRRLR